MQTKIKFSLFIVIASVFFIKAQTDDFEAKKYLNNKKTLLYRFMQPVAAKFNEKYPLVVFLHGAGERGDDNKSQLIHGIKTLADSAHRKDFPCFIAAPQCPKEKRWVEVDWDKKSHRMPIEPSISIKLLMELIDSIVSNYPIDRSRIYVTGLSMGGYGTWDIISRYPDKFAAAIPVCGGGDEKQAKNINIPVWAFHGSIDNIVPVERSRNMVKALRKTGGIVRYTEYQGVKHGSWFKAYVEDGLYEWLFQQKRK